MRMQKRTLWILITLLLVACDIKNDFPYPIVQGQITEFEVEGQCAADGSSDYTTAIDLATRTVTLYVCDTVDISKVRVTKVALAGASRNPDVHYVESPRITLDTDACVGDETFPSEGFDTLTLQQGVRINFTQPVRFTIRTYQDYEWTVKVARGIKREIKVEKQVGKAIIDPYLCNAIIYVRKSQRLDSLKVTKFQLEGEHQKISPNPTDSVVFDFSRVCEFDVTTAWGEIKKWRVVAYNKDEAPVNAWSNFAIINSPFDEKNLGRYDFSLQWRQEGDFVWNEMPKDSLKVDSIDYYVNAKITQLIPETSYEYRLCYANGTDSIFGDLEAFTTDKQIELYNGGFEYWNQSGNAWYANEAGKSYWDSSNPGSTSLGSSYNVTTSTESPVVSGKYAAKLESKYIVIKFAAASLYSGKFKELVGTSGAKLDWGVPFTARPTALKGWMQYAPVAIDRTGSNLPVDAPAKGEMDQCGMFVALLTEAIAIDNTDLSTIPNFETDPRVIAYGVLPDEHNVSSNGEWKEVNIPLVYRNLTTKPTHLLIVFSSSKYGDYFHGGTGSTLYLDDFSLEYGSNPLLKTESIENK